MHKAIKNIVLWWTPFGENDAVGKKGIFVNCKYSNCYITRNRTYFPNITTFDAIVFGRTITERKHGLPSVRSNKQKYIFAMTEPAPSSLPLCNPIYDGFFNWTWSYRLDSDVVWGYIAIYNSEGRLIGPKVNMHWDDLEFSKQYDLDLKKRFKRKRKAAAWFVSRCQTLSRREVFVTQFNKEFKSYGFEVDVYGKCGDMSCENCDELLEKVYFFYLAFENSFAEDYVTEKVLRAVDHFVIPVVYGGANYSRFLPPDSYLNAKELGVRELAKTMADIIHDPPRYRSFFRWVPHYKYVLSTYSVDMCNLCALLNDDRKVTSVSVYHDFVKWWNIDGACPNKKTSNSTATPIKERKLS